MSSTCKPVKMLTMHEAQYSILQGKDKDLLNRNFGQLYASMASVRNQFMDNHMQRPDAEDSSSSRKRKRLSIDITQKSQLLRKARSLAFDSSQRRHHLLHP